jgi:multiple sugar transport system substrate-binding protein
MRATRGTVSGTAAATCLLLAGLGACSEPEPAARPEPTASAPTSTAPSTPQRPLRLTVHGVPPAVAAYREVAQAFTAGTGVRVEVQAHPDAATSAQRVQGELRGSEPGPDVFLLDHDFLPQLLATERLQHLDQALEERELQFGDGYQRVALTAFSAEAALQCMPVEMSPAVMLVNRDHVRPRDLAIRGVPLPVQGQWSFDAFDAAARVIAREQSDEPDFRAVHLPIDVRLLTAFVRSAGGEVVDDVDGPTELTLDSEQAREVLLAYIRLGRLSSVNLSEDEAAERSALERFADGEIGMMFGTRSDVPALRESGVPFDVMPVPSFGSYRTVADIAGLCVDVRSDQLEEAMDLVAFVAGNEGSTTLARSGAVVPANLDVIFSPAFFQRGRRPTSVRVFGQALDRTGLMPFSTGWREVGARVERLVGGLVADRRNAVRVLDRRLPELAERTRTTFAPRADETDP